MAGLGPQGQGWLCLVQQHRQGCSANESQRVQGLKGLSCLTTYMASHAEPTQQPVWVVPDTRSHPVLPLCRGLTAVTAPLNSPVCSRCLTTSVGTRVREATAPAAAPDTTTVKGKSLVQLREQGKGTRLSREQGA
jgi:hypothetical protein